RRLQGRQMLSNLLVAIKKHRLTLPRQIPLLVKLSPDLDQTELDDALEVIIATGMDGIIATNTTLSRPGLHSPRGTEIGGLSGAPLTSLSLDMLKHIVQKVNGQIPVVSAGGVMTPTDVDQRLRAGAVLVQVYTGLVYSGPGLIKNLLAGRVK
ncbi:MAG: dihydroorotate dehydrogenase (quinone), partial [Chloroflexota bacterium]